VHVPISEKFKDEMFTSAAYGGLMRDNQKNISKELTLTLVWFYIGLAF
jgi:hypothetical protein